MARIQLRRGEHANLPNSAMLSGEPHITTDRGNLHVATDATTRLPVTPAIDMLSNLGSIAPGDFLLIHDVSATTGQREFRVTFENFKLALNIPEGGSDEMVAVVEGGEAGYLWGSDGTDGVIRMGASMQWTKDAGDGFVTLNVNVVDGGTFGA